MWRWIGLGVGVLFLAIAVLWILLVVSLRTKFSPALKAIRRLNRVFWNPRAMRVAGQPGAYASVIHHLGRTSGRPYQTPVGAVGTDDGFVIGLPYGTTPDWLRNVIATGSAVIDDEGDTCHVEQPELVPAVEVNHYFSRKDQWIHRLYGVDQFLYVRRVRTGATVGDHP